MQDRLPGGPPERLQLHAARLLEGAMRALGLSARGYARVLKVARTIADLAGEPKIGITHIAESIQYREQSRSMT